MTVLPPSRHLSSPILHPSTLPVAMPPKVEKIEKKRRATSPGGAASSSKRHKLDTYADDPWQPPLITGSAPALISAGTLTEKSDLVDTSPSPPLVTFESIEELNAVMSRIFDDLSIPHHEAYLHRSQAEDAAVSDQNQHSTIKSSSSSRQVPPSTRKSGSMNSKRSRKQTTTSQSQASGGPKHVQAK